jgi:dsDNA-specific endonuclease/ATPase MutS2
LNLEDLQKHLNLELTDTERDILYEFTRAREVMEVLNHPGWLHIQDLMDSKVSNIETRLLEVKNLSPDALWAMHIAVQYVRDFVKAIKSQLATTGDWLKDPQAIQDMINRANLPDPADLEGELGGQ